MQHFTDLATFLNSGHFRRKVPNSLLYRLPLEAHIKWRHQRIHPMCLNDKLRSRQHQTEGHLRPERVMSPWHWHSKMEIYITKTWNLIPLKEDPSRQVTSFRLTSQIDISSISKNDKDIQGPWLGWQFGPLTDPRKRRSGRKPAIRSPRQLWVETGHIDFQIFSNLCLKALLNWKSPFRNADTLSGFLHPFTSNNNPNGPSTVASVATGAPPTAIVPGGWLGPQRFQAFANMTDNLPTRNGSEKKKTGSKTWFWNKVVVRRYRMVWIYVS